MNLSEMTYKAFGKLKYLDWFSKEKDYYKDPVEGYETEVGLTLEEGGASAALFMSKSGQTVMVELDFTYMSDSMVSQSHSFLDSLGLALRKGMTKSAITQELGKSTCTQHGLPAWVFGAKYRYYVTCAGDPKSGLYRVEIYRKDLADKKEKLEYR